MIALKSINGIIFTLNPSKFKMWPNSNWFPTPHLFVFLFISYFDDVHTRERVLLCACFISADISTVICDKMDKARVLLENVERKETPGLRRVILMDAFDSDLVEQGKGCGVHVQAIKEVEVRHVGLWYDCDTAHHMYVKYLDWGVLIYYIYIYIY